MPGTFYCSICGERTVYETYCARCGLCSQHCICGSKSRAGGKQREERVPEPEDDEELEGTT
jgi:hypothetical protein